MKQSTKELKQLKEIDAILTSCEKDLAKVAHKTLRMLVELELEMRELEKLEAWADNFRKENISQERRVVA